MQEVLNFFATTAIMQMNWSYIVMILVGLFFIWLGISKDYEPLLLVPIGFGIILGNIPNTMSGVYDAGSVMNQLYFGVRSGLYPPLIFLGIGAMTDFSNLIANPKLILLGAAAQIGIFATLIGAILLGFNFFEAASIGIIGGADGPTSIFLSSRLAPHLVGPIAIAAYSYMALVPVIQPPIMLLLTNKKERLIRMKAPRVVTQREKIFFPLVVFMISVLVAPGAAVLLGMLCLGNLLKESGVTDRLARTASNALIDIVTIIIGVSVGASTQADVFLTSKSILIFGLGAFSFCMATAGGVLFAKFMNLFLKEGEKLHPFIGAAGVSAVPDSARVAHNLARTFDKNNFLLMHAMAPNVAGVIGSAIAAGVLLGVVGN